MNRSDGNAPCTGATQAGDPWRSKICVFSPARTAWLGSRVPETLAPGDQLAVMSCSLTTVSFSACSSSGSGGGSRRGERVDTRDGVDLIKVPVCRQQPLDAVGPPSSRRAGRLVPATRDAAPAGRAHGPFGVPSPAGPRRRCLSLPGTRFGRLRAAFGRHGSGGSPAVLLCW